jgi:hypothetical protein
MSVGVRSEALATACDDLQAQLEAGDRSMRHLDHDVLLLDEALQAAFVHADRMGNLQLHMRELRANMREQREALREVRRAAHLLCDSVARARERLTSLVEEKATLDANDAALRGEQARLQTLTDVVNHHDAENSHVSQTGLHDVRSRPLESRTTRLDPPT